MRLSTNRSTLSIESIGQPYRSSRSIKSIGQLYRSSRSVNSIDRVDRSTLSIESIGQLNSIDRVDRSTLSIESIGPLYRSSGSTTLSIALTAYMTATDCDRNFGTNYAPYINTIQDRFKQRGYKIYSNLEQLLLKVCQQENFDQELEDACSFFKDDFERETLRAQLITFGIDFQRKVNTKDDIVKIKPTWVDIKEYFQSLQVSQKALLSQVCNVLKILLVMPVTNATSERSFSALRRVKSYLRSTMHQQRLNHLMTLHVHKHATDMLKSSDIASEFVEDSDHRLKIFGAS